MLSQMKVHDEILLAGVTTGAIHWPTRFARIVAVVRPRKLDDVWQGTRVRVISRVLWSDVLRASGPFPPRHDTPSHRDPHPRHATPPGGVAFPSS